MLWRTSVLLLEEAEHGCYNMLLVNLFERFVYILFAVWLTEL